MTLNDKKVGDFVSQISIDELLRTCGISLAKWSNDLLYTDAAYSEGWLEEVGEQMASISFLCHHFFHIHKEVPRDVMIDLPSDLWGIVSVNPLLKTSMDETPTKSEGQSHDGDDLFPF